MIALLAIAANLSAPTTALNDRALDSLYRLGRESLSRREYRVAADLFARVATVKDTAGRSSSALFWRGYSLYADGSARHDTVALHAAIDALDWSSRTSAPDRVIREARKLRAQVIATGAAFDMPGAVSAMNEAERTLSGAVTCDEASIDLDLLALARVVDRDHEGAMPTVERVSLASGPCAEELRRGTYTLMSNTPGMSAATLAGLPAGARELQPGGRSASVPQGLPAIRPIGSMFAQARLVDGLSSGGMRVLSNGSVLMSNGHTVQLYDSTLTDAMTVQNLSGPVSILAFAADSSLVVEMLSRTMSVVDPSGKIARTIDLPAGFTVNRLRTARYAGGTAYLVRGDPELGMLSRSPIGTTIVEPDSLPLLRIDIASGRIDTLARLATSPTTLTVTDLGSGAIGAVPRYNPLSVQDAWAAAGDEVAILRTSDYHVDWLASGHTLPSPGIPHEWLKMTDSIKRAFMDSSRAADSVARSRMSLSMVLPTGETMTRSSTMAPAVDLSELPDYLPAFNPVGNPSATIEVDQQGNLWIASRLVHPPTGGPVYDVVNHDGKLIDRVQLPPHARLIGFDAKAAFLLFTDSNPRIAAVNLY